MYCTYILCIFASEWSLIFLKPFISLVFPPHLLGLSSAWGDVCFVWLSSWRGAQQTHLFLHVQRASLESLLRSGCNTAFGTRASCSTLPFYPNSKSLMVLIRVLEDLVLGALGIKNTSVLNFFAFRWLLAWLFWSCILAFSQNCS